MLQEIGIKRHFAALKRPFRGSPSIKDYLFGNLSLNARQCRQLSGMSGTDFQRSNSTKDREQLTLAELKVLSKQGCAAAVQLYA